MARGPKRTRPRGKRRLSPRLIVACEGETTEVDYLASLNQVVKHRAALIPLRGKGPDACKVVQAAIRQRREDRGSGVFLAGDRAYALLDVEPHDPAKADRLDEAMRLAADNDVCVLLSNPCFEFWLLCHTAEPGELCRSFPDPRAVNAELRRRTGHGKEEFHAHPARFERLLKNVQAAVEVARRVHKEHHRGITDLRNANACTTLYQLVAYLLGQRSAPP